MRGFALSVSDILPERVPERVTAITLLSYGCQNLCAVCIRHDSRSVENFVKAVTDTCSMWDGAIILETSDPTALDIQQHYAAYERGIARAVYKAVYPRRFPAEYQFLLAWWRASDGRVAFL